MTIRTLIVDDEEPARELLRSFLSHYPDVDIAGEAGDGAAALEMISNLAPDLVFLDVQMPRMSGFDVVAALDPNALPLIVFVTAYDQYALRAFEVSACDYLLKPFDADRLANTMRRVLFRREQPGADVHSAVRTLLAHVRPAAEQVVVKADGRHIFLAADEIERFEAVGKDVRVHLGAKTLLVRESMNGLAGRLDATQFLRVHRSAIVNRSHIREMQPWFKGDYVIITRTGARIVSGRTYRAAVKQLIELSRSH
ncbi:MAG: LytTR family DNA-binding domain-containing protein [Gemmatimonadaceae bacterium]